MPPTLYSAAVVCPMSGPPLPDGGVLVADGWIAAVGPAAPLREEGVREHQVDGVIVPGLVNGHTHLEHADAAHLAASGPLAEWQRAVEGTTTSWAAERWGRSAHRGVLRALRSGTTTVFDTVTRGPAVPAAARAGLAGDSFVEVSDVDVDRVDDVLAQVEHALGLPADGRRVGVGLADPTRLSSGVLQSLVSLAKRCDAPVQLHAARSDPGAAALSEGSSLVHGVQVEAEEARLLSRLGITVVCSPRASTRLQMGDPPLELFADAGVALALGTESPAAVGDLDVLAEAAAWVATASRRGLQLWPTPAGPVPLPEAALRLATVDGAQALGWGERCGVLEPGRRADLVGIDVPTSPATVYRDIVEQGSGRQVLTVVAGVRKARRGSGEEQWPAIDDDGWR